MAKELAAAALASEGGKWTPDNIGWSLVNEQLAQLIDLQTKWMMMNSTTPKRIVDPFPRPETEFQRLLLELQAQKAEANLSRIYELVDAGQQRWLEGHRPKGWKQPDGE